MNTNSFILKHCDLDLIRFDIVGKEVSFAVINKDQSNFLPLPLKRILHNKQEFVKTETEDNYLLNEEGCYLLDAWLFDREIPANRDNYNSYIKKGHTSRDWMLENNAYSFTDCYWIMKENNPLTWNDICKRLDSVDNFYTVKEDNRMYKGNNSTLGGELEKFWYKSNGVLKLCKKTPKQFDVLNARELIASLIYKKQGYENYCDYHFVYDEKQDVIGVKCKAFTDKKVELVTAYDLLEEYNRTQQDNIYELIIDFACKYGCNRESASNYMDIQTMVDYLITNRDRHQGNIGFLRDSSSLQIIGPAPVYDSGSSKHLEGAYPEKADNTTVNGLYNTETECLAHVKNPLLLDIKKLPSKEEIKFILDQCQYIPDKRKLELLDLYFEKTKYLNRFQQKYISFEVDEAKFDMDDIDIDKEI